MPSWFKRKKTLTDLLKEKNKSDFEEKVLSENSVGFLKKSSDFFRSTFIDVFKSHQESDEKLREKIEESLISLDFGVFLSSDLSSKIVKRFSSSKNSVHEIIKRELFNFYFSVNSDQKINFLPGRTNFFLIVGANGSGKTTSIAKIVNLYKQQGFRILIIAADTFRAGAVDQLKFGADKLGVDICVSDKFKEDPAALVYRSLVDNKDKNYDLIICDTSGRQHNNVNLLNELNKVYRVIGKFGELGPHETLLVLDSTIGQGSFMQAKNFLDSSKVTGIVLTKMDGLSKGGIIFSIKQKFNVPVKFVGTGEREVDICEFDLNQILDAGISIDF